MLVQWREQHGRWPAGRECRPEVGLLWANTYYRVFSAHAWSAVLSGVLDCTSGVSSSSAGARLKRCMNAPACSAWIVDEGRHIRLCAACKRPNHHGRGIDPDPEPVLTRAQLTRWGIGQADWRDLTDWEEGAG